jgi:phosphoglycerol transferase
MAVVAALGALLIVGISPALIYQHEHGPNPTAAKRPAQESEVYAGSLTQTVMPIPGHRINALARLQNRYQTSSLTHGEVGMQIGFVLSASLFGLLFVLLARAVNGRPALTRRSRLAGAAAAGLLIAFLFDTFGGLGSLIATLISPQIRAWNRLTPFLAFFALIGLVLALELAMGWVRARAGTRARTIPALLAVLVGVVALWDQTSSSYIPDYQANAASWRSDTRFVGTLEQTLPKNAMVLQLPLHTFPEEPGDGFMLDYDLLKGYLHSTDLRWSYGAMKGRPEDWTTPALSKPLPDVVRGAIAAGFVGVYVDRHGWFDYGKAVERELGQVLGVDGPSFASEDGRLSYFDASKLAEAQKARLSPQERADLGQSVVRPLVVSYKGGLLPVEGDKKTTWNWLGATGTIDVDNTSGVPRPMVLKASAASDPSTVLRITAPGQPAQVVRFARGREEVRVHFMVPAGKSTIALAADGPNLGGNDPRDLRVRLYELEVTQDLQQPTVKVGG